MIDLQKSADQTFLSLTIWREARGEIFLAKLAVAYSILNRVARPSWWGNDIMSVVFKRWQYSSLTAPGDPQLATWPNAADAAWRDAMRAANEAISGTTPNPVPGADSYYDLSIAPPKWADPKKFVKAVDKFRFFNLDQDHEAAEVHTS
jgi:spore germination cell wall hydrolase CwlJ-like protein